MLGIKNNTTILGIKTACLFGYLMMSLTAHAELNCDPRSGKIIQANNKKEYCISLNTMNWWTSLGWCESIGGTLLEYPKDCQCDNDECLRTDCPALAT